MNKRLQKLLADQGAHRGNAWTNIQFSNFIRATHETECNGFTFPPGKLRDCDMKPYRSSPRYSFACAMADRFKDRTCILYVWRTSHATYGATITDRDNRVLARAIRTGPRFSESLMELEKAAGLIH